MRAGARLAAPLLPQAAAMLGLLSGDVLLTRWLVGEAATGAYQVALQLGNMPFVLAVALFNAWGAARAVAPPRPTVAVDGPHRHRPDRRRRPRCGGGRAARPVARRPSWPAPASTTSRWSGRSGSICTVAVSYMVYQGSSLAVLDAERTGRLAWAALAALAVVVALALWLAPLHGIVGVAVAKALGYAVLMGLTTWFARGHSPLRWPAASVARRDAVQSSSRSSAPWLRSRAAPRGCGSSRPLRWLLSGWLLAPRILRTLRG